MVSNAYLRKAILSLDGEVERHDVERLPLKVTKVSNKRVTSGIANGFKEKKFSLVVHAMTSIYNPNAEKVEASDMIEYEGKERIVAYVEEVNSSWGKFNKEYFFGLE